jgi:uncharacterized protein YqkB
MKFTFSQPAIDRLSQGLPDKDSRLKLIYDTEGCGCAVNGVPALQIIREANTDDRKAEGGPFEVWYDPKQEVFFEDELKVDFNEARNAYILKSDNQIYTTNMRLLT